MTNSFLSSNKSSLFLCWQWLLEMEDKLIFWQDDVVCLSDTAQIWCLFEIENTSNFHTYSSLITLMTTTTCLQYLAVATISNRMAVVLRNHNIQSNSFNTIGGKIEVVLSNPHIQSRSLTKN